MPPWKCLLLPTKNKNACKLQWRIEFAPSSMFTLTWWPTKFIPFWEKAQCLKIPQNCRISIFGIFHQLKETWLIKIELFLEFFINFCRIKSDLSGYTVRPKSYSNYRIWIFQFWHFSSIFVVFKVTYLVTLLDRKITQNVAFKLFNFGIFHQFLAF